MGDTTRRATLIISAKDDASQGISDSALKFTELNSAIELGKKAIEAFKQVYDFAEQGAAIQRIGEQWQATAGQFGVNADAVLASIDKATNGTVDDEALMKIATRELTQNVVSNGQQLTDFFGIARAMTVRFGGDIVANSQAIDMAIETGMTRQLKAKGIVVDFTQAYKDYAAQMGVTVASLDDATKMEIRRNEVLAQGEVLVKKVGDTGADAATKFEQFNRNLTEIGDTFKVLASNAVVPFIGAMDEQVKVINSTATNTDKLNYILTTARQLYGDNSIQAQIAQRAVDQYNGAVQKAKDSQDAFNTKIKDGTAYLQSGYIPAVSQATDAEVKMNSAIDSSYSIAIKYTDQAKKMSDEQQKLADLDAAIASQGVAHIAVINKVTLSTDERTLKQMQLNDTLREYARVQANVKPGDEVHQAHLAKLSGTIDSLKKSLESYTGVVGGATVKQQEERQAILDTITAMQTADVKAAGTTAYDTLSKQFADNKISAGDFESRMAMLNTTFGIFDQTQLATAIHTAEFQKVLADPNSTAQDFQNALWGIKSATLAVDGSLKTTADKTLPHINAGLKDTDSIAGNLGKNTLPFMAKASAEAHTKIQSQIEHTNAGMQDLNASVTTVGSNDPSGEGSGGKGGKSVGPIPGLKKILEQSIATGIKVDNLSDKLYALPNIDRTIKYTISIEGTVPSGGAGGGHAAGGTIYPGEVSTVGESGMELAIGGAGGTTIVPLNGAGGGSKVGGGGISINGGLHLHGVQNVQELARQLNQIMGNQSRLAMAGGAGILGS